ncbi:adenylyltransferase/sulfurtransferase MoeZ [Arthrobacter sp. MYb227]|uniref:molybdopterin-synthase adenylyltransferase MoeB n=1 Tax=Arthrobacter sp. MYb227 TaxID=1848601 RepID=UPI000CFB580B|nr:molybdopterin-synthase adenylyltransferase MoeB [Arthrobacter sp. MYb227]PQZ95948.1 adenylyltransferase/sulfurtransferase MoeZ [Arthrobacter sp. MYb227]
MGSEKSVFLIPGVADTRGPNTAAESEAGAVPGPLVQPAAELSQEELLRYSRQIIIPEIGMIGQLRLKNARVLVIGAGGLGSPALLYLAAAGIGSIGIIDADVVDTSNLQRQVIHSMASIGQLKTESAAARIKELNPLVDVHVHSYALDVGNAREIFSAYDVILDGTDNFATRYLVNDAAALCGKPYVWGSILRFDGQVSVFWDAHGPNYRDLYPTPPPAGSVPSCSEGGVFGVLCAQIGSVMVAETIKLITGVGQSLLGRVLILDSLDMRWREVKLQADPQAAQITELLRNYEAFCAGPVSTSASAGLSDEQLPQLSAPQLARRLAERAAGKHEFLLVDVREAGEHEIVAIPGALLAPKGAILSGEITLPRDTELIVHCKSGVRSAAVLRFLQDQGYNSVENLRGGILAWIAEVDPSLHTY